MSFLRTCLGIVVAVMLVAGGSQAFTQSTLPSGSWRVAADHSRGHGQVTKQGMGSTGHTKAMKHDEPVHISMQELHATGGVPRGWKFSVPEGDPEAGQQAFVELQCYSCHRVTGDKLPVPKGIGEQPGPDLGGMGVHHPAAYFAEAILSPSKVVITGEGHTGKDGLSIMPMYQNMTLGQLVDLVAYMKSLTGPMASSPHKGAMQMGESSPGSQGAHGGHK